MAVSPHIAQTRRDLEAIDETTVQYEQEGWFAIHSVRIAAELSIDSIRGEASKLNPEIDLEHPLFLQAESAVFERRLSSVVQTLDQYTTIPNDLKADLLYDEAILQLRTKGALSSAELANIDTLIEVANTKFDEITSQRISEFDGAFAVRFVEQIRAAGGLHPNVSEHFSNRAILPRPETTTCLVQAVLTISDLIRTRDIRGIRNILQSGELRILSREDYWKDRVRDSIEDSVVSFVQQDDLRVVDLLLLAEELPLLDIVTAPKNWERIIHDFSEGITSGDEDRTLKTLSKYASMANWLSSEECEEPIVSDFLIAARETATELLLKMVETGGPSAEALSDAFRVVDSYLHNDFLSSEEFIDSVVRGCRLLMEKDEFELRYGALIGLVPIGSNLNGTPREEVLQRLRPEISEYVSRRADFIRSDVERGPEGLADTFAWRRWSPYVVGLVDIVYQFQMPQDLISKVRLSLPERTGKANLKELISELRSDRNEFDLEGPNNISPGYAVRSIPWRELEENLEIIVNRILPREAELLSWRMEELAVTHGLPLHLYQRAAFAAYQSAVNCTNEDELLTRTIEANRICFRYLSPSHSVAKLLETHHYNTTMSQNWIGER